MRLTTTSFSVIPGTHLEDGASPQMMLTAQLQNQIDSLEKQVEVLRNELFKRDTTISKLQSDVKQVMIASGRRDVGSRSPFADQERDIVAGACVEPIVSSGPPQIAGNYLTVVSAVCLLACFGKQCCCKPSCLSFHCLTALIDIFGGPFSCLVSSLCGVVVSRKVINRHMTWRRTGRQSSVGVSWAFFRAMLPKMQKKKR